MGSEVPEHLWRFTTKESVDGLAKRFDLPSGPHMQDWECEVAEPTRIGEFLAAYEGGELNEDERFTLMEIIIESFEKLADNQAIEGDKRWERTLWLLDAHIDLHIYTVWYWAMPEEDSDQSLWRVAPFIRTILQKHRVRFETPGNRRGG